MLVVAGKPNQAASSHSALMIVTKFSRQWRWWWWLFVTIPIAFHQANRVMVAKKTNPSRALLPHQRERCASRGRKFVANHGPRTRRFLSYGWKTKPMEQNKKKIACQIQNRNKREPVGANAFSRKPAVEGFVACHFPNALRARGIEVFCLLVLFMFLPCALPFAVRCPLVDDSAGAQGRIRCVEGASARELGGGQADEGHRYQHELLHTRCVMGLVDLVSKIVCACFLVAFCRREQKRGVRKREILAIKTHATL